MIDIAFCDISESVDKIMESIKRYADNNSIYCQFHEYSNVDEVIESGINFKIIFLNNAYREAIQSRIEKYMRQVRNSGDEEKRYRIMVFLDNPISEKDTIDAIDMCKPYLLKWSLVEFLTEQGLKSINMNEILYFEYVNRRVIINLTDKKYVIKDKINGILSKMQPYGFSMPHKSFVVNMLHIKEIKNYNISIGDISIPLAQKRSANFRKIYNEYIHKYTNKN